MKPYLFFIAWLALAAPSGAMQGEGGILEGDVRRADTGDPLVAVVITLEASHSTTAVTDTAGHFVLRNVRPGPYVIRASRSGYSAPVGDGVQAVEAGAESRGVIRTGERIENVRLALILSRVLSGRILDPEGHPAAGMTVRALRVPEKGGVPTLIREAQTNERGEYRLWGLDPGKYYVAGRLDSNGILRIPWNLAVVWHETFYPGVLAHGKAAALDVTATASIEGLDFRLLAAQGFDISGTVTHPSLDLSGAGPTLVLIPRDAAGIDAGSIQTLPGRYGPPFSIRGVLAGNYTLLATLFQWERDSNSTRRVMAAGFVDLTVSSDRTDVTITLGSSELDVTGGIFNTDGTPWNSGMRSLGITLRPVDEDAFALPFLMDAAGHLSTETINGTFRLNNVPPGIYAIAVSNLPPHEAVKETRIGSSDAGVIGAEGLRVAGKSPGPVRIIIATLPGPADRDAR